MIPRPFERQAPPKPPTPVDPPEMIELDATSIEINFSTGSAQFMLFAEDTYEFSSAAILIEYAENLALGRVAEKIMVFTGQVLYMSEKKVKIQVPAPKFIPSAAVTPSAADPVVS